MAGDPKRQPKDFNHQKPEATDGWRDITDPIGAARQAQGLSPVTDYPKHLVRADGPGQRAVAVAQDAAHERELREQGHMTHHELDAVERESEEDDDDDAPVLPAKPVAAKRPRNVKPKAKAAADESVN